MIPLTKLFKYWTYQAFSPGTVLRDKYEAFKSLLRNDKRAHELMAELEEIYYDMVRVDFRVIEDKYDEFSHCVSNMVEDITKMCPSRYLDLKDYFKKFDFYVRFMLAPKEYDFSPPFTIPLSDISADDLTLVGGKALNLGIIKRTLELPIPTGFVITTNAFHYFIEYNDLWKSINERLSELDINSTSSLGDISKDLRDSILNAQTPPEIQDDILDRFQSLFKKTDRDVRVAIRSSAVGEDSRSSFAGQYRTVLNVGEKEILDAYKEVIASKYEPRALYYRINYGLSDLETPMAVIALEMIDAAASGVIYTRELDYSESDELSIHSIWGLGELLVSGEASPDIIKVSKDHNPHIVHKKIGLKPKQMVFSRNGGTETIPVDDEKQESVSLDDRSALALSNWAIRLEKHYDEPQDIEWCMDQEDNLFLLQSRPLKLEEREAMPLESIPKNVPNAVLLSGGEKACSGVGAGKVFKIEHESDLDTLPEGAILVARNTLPKYVKVMDRLSAVVTDIGSPAGHFSSVAREFGVPTLVNTGEATAKLTQGKEVTVHADGKVVYDGFVESLLELPVTRRKLISDSPFERRLRYIINFVSPLRLTDPQSPSFVAEGVRSLHDIIRFSHEKAVQEMFHMGEKRVRKVGGSRKLISHIPMIFYVFDVGGGLKEELANKRTVTMDEIESVPMKEIFRGLSHPDIQWSDFTHFNWEEYDRIVMSGGIISPESAMLASYAVISRNYLNLNLRFGYHFVILDSICQENPEDNYIMFRFSGGGTEFENRALRANFLTRVLERLGFDVDKKGDLVDGQLGHEDEKSVRKKLDIIGRLLGATRLMDMYLKDHAMVERFVEEFMNGRYHFATVDDS
jgi:pyruvate,water dikinase